MKDRIVHISFAKTDFNCPECDKLYTEKDYFERLRKANDHYIYKTCKECGCKMGISTNIMGNVVVWDKSKEPKL